MIAELLFRFQKPFCGLKDHSFPQAPDGGNLRGRQRHAEREFATLSLGTDNLKIYLSTAPKAAGADGWFIAYSSVKVGIYHPAE